MTVSSQLVRVSYALSALLVCCRKNGRGQVQVNTEFPGLSVVSSIDGGHKWTEFPVGASRRNTTLMLATRFVPFSLQKLYAIFRGGRHAKLFEQDTIMVQRDVIREM